MEDDGLEARLASVRHMLPEIENSDLVEYLERTIALQVAHEVGVKLGMRIHDENTDQLYRMSLFSAREEILRRMTKQK